MIKRILVGLGGTPYTQSEVKHAIELARIHKAEITAVTIVDLQRISNVGPVPMGAGAAAAELVEHRLASAQAACRAAADLVQRDAATAGVRCRVIAEAGNPIEELIGLWRYHDLTILALRSLFEYGVVHDPLDMIVRIIARGVRPILAVSQQYRPVQRVLIAYNGSMESAKAMKHFVHTQPWGEVTARIVCLEMTEDQAKPLLADSRDYCRAHGLNVETAFHPENAETGLLKQAEAWNADAIVMGSTARARIFKHLLGDTALHAVKHSTIPLFMTQ